VSTTFVVWSREKKEHSGIDVGIGEGRERERRRG
jgi:hypothetical protein